MDSTERTFINSRIKLAVNTNFTVLLEPSNISGEIIKSCLDNLIANISKISVVNDEAKLYVKSINSLLTILKLKVDTLSKTGEGLNNLLTFISLARAKARSVDVDVISIAQFLEEEIIPLIPDTPMVIQYKRNGGAVNGTRKDAC